MKSNTTTITITKDTRNKTRKLEAYPNETFNSIQLRLIKFYNENKEKE